MLPFRQLARAANQWLPRTDVLARSYAQRAARPYDLEINKSTTCLGVDVGSILVRLKKPCVPVRVDLEGSRVKTVSVMIPGKSEGEIVVTTDAATEIQEWNLLPTDQIAIAREKLPESARANLRFFPTKHLDSSKDYKIVVRGDGMTVWHKEAGSSGQTYARDTERKVHPYVERAPRLC